MNTATIAAPTIRTFVCPQCGAITTRESVHEVVAMYCLHRGETTSQLVRMEALEPAPAPEEGAALAGD